MAPLIVIAGPTACGKTQAAVSLALRIGGEVVSADSMQVYRGMDIGTAKPTMAERQGVPHHLLDVASPDEAFSAARYQALAAAAITAVHERGRIPILTGGTGFYINAVLYGTQFFRAGEDDALHAKEAAYRAELAQLAAEKGNAYLHDLLRAVDPAAAAAIHPNNVKRVARAVSFHRFTGECISRHNASQRENAPQYEITFILLEMDRSALYARINARVTAMLQAGLAEEVRGLLAAGYHEGLVAMQGLGYKEMARYLRGQCTLTEAAEAIRVGTRHYAKRQLTWFGHRSPEAQRLYVDDTVVDNIVQAFRKGRGCS